MTETQEKISALLMEFFNNDTTKVGAWMNTPNPLLGNMIPYELIAMGREEKLLRFIENAISENKCD